MDTAGHSREGIILALALSAEPRPPIAKCGTFAIYVSPAILAAHQYLTIGDYHHLAITDNDSDTDSGGHGRPRSLIVRIGASDGEDDGGGDATVCALLAWKLQSWAIIDPVITAALSSAPIAAESVTPVGELRVSAVLSAEWTALPKPGTVLASLASTFLDGVIINADSVIALDWRSTAEVFTIATIAAGSACNRITRETKIVFNDRDSQQSRSKRRCPSVRDWCSAVNSAIIGYDDIVSEVVDAIHSSVTSTGNDSRLSTLCQLPQSFLFYGLPGCGKTSIVRAIARASEFPTLTLTASHLYHRHEGEGEQAIKQLFKSAADSAPSFIILDDVDSIARYHDASNVSDNESEASTIERSLLAEVISQMDSLLLMAPRPPVFLLMTSVRLSSLSPSLIRAGRIDRKFALSALSNEARLRTLQHLAQSMPFHPNDDRQSLLSAVNDRLHGFVGADIEKICREVTLRAISRASTIVHNDTDCSRQSLADSVVVTLEDFDSVLATARPANLANRDFVLPATLVKDLPFQSLAGVGDIVDQLFDAVINPLKQLTQSSLSASVMTTAPSGLLLYGPSGVGKSSLAVSVARATGLTPLLVSSTAIVSKVVGASESALTALFASARASAPCVLIMDEIDVIGGARGDASDNDSYQRLLSCLLQELDGISRASRQSNRPVFLIATSSRPHTLDAALLRPGRLDYHQFCPRPNVTQRFQILDWAFRKTPLRINDHDRELWWQDDDDNDRQQRFHVSDSDDSAEDRACREFLSHVALSTVDCSSADLIGMVRESAMAQLRASTTDIDSVTHVDSHYVVSAMQSVRPSLRGVADYHPIGFLHHEHVRISLP